jgi:hypothetical protein
MTVRFEVLLGLGVEGLGLWDMMSCGWINKYCQSGGKCYLFLHSRIKWIKQIYPNVDTS